ncbi:hypothetical protein HPB50_026967 [Hyalomma asiaticum]|uniref:Uncharacterized protein n=1 Tax=Hyalomma asiaticum TaxID=266040 RepID=A0ACB7T206_HYAAI|nr:hypothetical protein HPB50_026967 [Hyalomma asiaticum]
MNGGRCGQHKSKQNSLHTGLGLVPTSFIRRLDTAVAPCSAAGLSKGSLPVPPVLWAQRKNVVYVKVALEDCKNPAINITADSLHFKGTGGAESKPHEVMLRFLHPIKPEESRYVVRPRGTEFVLAKAEEGPFWKRLLQDDVKHHWLKVDFNKWVDEDDSGDELGAGGGDFEEMMRSMGGLGDDDTPDMVDLLHFLCVLAESSGSPLTKAMGSMPACVLPL